MKKFVQIIPAPPGLRSVFKDDTGEEFASPALCLALDEEGDIHVIDYSPDGVWEVSDETLDFKCFRWLTENVSG